MAVSTEKQKQTAIQDIEELFRARGNDLLDPVVLDDDGNEVAGAEKIFDILSKGGRVRIPGEGNAVPDILRMNKNGVLYTLTAEEQAYKRQNVEENYKRYGLEGEPAGIDEEGRPVTGADKIVEALTQGKEIRFRDTEQPGAYHTMVLSDEGNVDVGWRAPESFARVVPEGHENVSEPQRPEYMDRPDEPEVIEQKESVMIQAQLRAYGEKKWRDAVTRKSANDGEEPLWPLNNLDEPLKTIDAILETLSRGDPVYMPEGEAGYRRLLYGDGVLYQSKETVPAGEYVSFEQMQSVDYEAEVTVDPRETYLDENGFTTAQDSQGNVYTTKKEILEHLRQDREKLLLFNADRSIVAAAQTEDSVFKATPLMNAADVDPALYDRFPGMLPDDGDNILTFKKDEISHAVDETGRRYETPDTVRIALYGTDKRLSIYKNGEEAPYDVFKKNNRFYIGKKPDLVESPAFRSVSLLEDPFAPKQFLKDHWLFDGVPGPVEHKGPEWAAGAPHFAFALDKDGNVYRDLDSAADFLSAKDRNRLFVFDKEGDLPYAVEMKDGKMHMSNAPVGSENRLYESNAFEPKKSLDVDDIVKRADYAKLSLAKDDYSDWSKREKYYKKNIRAIELVKNAGQPKPPIKPKKPSLGFFNSIAYGVVWLVTFGKGDTQAHKEYVQDLENYPHVVAAYPKLVDEFKKKKEKWDDYLENGEKKLTEYRAGLKRVEKKVAEAAENRNKANETYNNELKNNDVEDVRDYREHLEVKLEGVADLQKQGKITRNNIFAHTWLKETECSGKKASDPEARKALLSFVASKQVEDQILKDRISGKLVNVGVEERRVDDLNSGRAYQALANDPDVNDMLNEMGDKPINPYRFYDDLVKKLAVRGYESKGYKAVYQENEKAMNFTFGKKKVDESCVDDLIRLNRLHEMQKQDSAYAVPYDEQSANDIYKNARDRVRSINRNPITAKEREPFLKAVKALEGEGPFGLDEMLNKVLAKKQEQVAAENAAAEAEGPQPQMS